MSKQLEKQEKDRLSKNAFLICPIGEVGSEIRKRADQILKHVIEPVASENGYKVIRADKISEPGIITSQIINHIINDELVIADLTGHNPNVFYELAVRHSLKKPIVQLIQKDEKIPFDVSTTRTIPVDHKDLDSVDDAKRELTKQIQAVEKDPSKVDSPISNAMDLQVLKQSQNPELKVMADVKALMEKLDRGMNRIQERMDYLYNRQNVRFSDYPIATERLPEIRIEHNDADLSKRVNELNKTLESLERAKKLALSRKIAEQIRRKKEEAKEK
jgi:hypothetical protein